MPFFHYDPSIKSRHAEKRMAGLSIDEANRDLITKVSKRSTQRWVANVRNTGHVNRDPASYEDKGPDFVFDEDDLQTIFEVLEEDPTLTLDEIRDIMFELTEKLAGISTIHETIVKRLGYTVKTGLTVDHRQSEEQRSAFAQRVENLPSQYLVFLGEFSHSCFLVINLCHSQLTCIFR